MHSMLNEGRFHVPWKIEAYQNQTMCAFTLVNFMVCNLYSSFKEWSKYFNHDTF